MPWTLLSVPSTRKADLDAALRDDLLSRQSLKVRDAPSLGGPAATVYVLVEGTEEATRRAESLLAEFATRLPAAVAQALYARLKEEEENASSGMGLFFTD